MTSFPRTILFRSVRMFSFIVQYDRHCIHGRLRLKCDGTRAETRFRLSAKKRTSQFKSAGASVQ